MLPWINSWPFMLPVAQPTERSMVREDVGFFMLNARVKSILAQRTVESWDEKDFSFFMF